MELMGSNGVSIPIDSLVDNKSVMNAIYSTKSANDKRLNIVVGSIKERRHLGVNVTRMKKVNLTGV